MEDRPKDRLLAFSAFAPEENLIRLFNRTSVKQQNVLRSRFRVHSSSESGKYPLRSLHPHSFTSSHEQFFFFQAYQRTPYSELTDSELTVMGSPDKTKFVTFKRTWSGKFSFQLHYPPSYRSFWLPVNFHPDAFFGLRQDTPLLCAIKGRLSSTDVFNEEVLSHIKNLLASEIFTLVVLNHFHTSDDRIFTLDDVLALRKSAIDRHTILSTLNT